MSYNKFPPVGKLWFTIFDCYVDGGVDGGTVQDNLVSRLHLINRRLQALIPDYRNGDLTTDVLSLEMSDSVFGECGNTDQGTTITEMLRQASQQFDRTEEEGFVLKAVHSPYQIGRATQSYPSQVKFKNIADAEATVVEVIQGMENNNPP